MNFFSRRWFALVDWIRRVGVLVVVLSGALLVLLAVFVAVMFCENPGWVFERFGVCDKFEILKFLGIGMGGILLALQALASHRRARAMEVAATAQGDAAKAQAEATKEQAKANLHTEQGQRQERLKNAIEHLGHASVSVRLGGTYELFQLAKDAKKEAEDIKESRQTVLDILCAHIRQTTSAIDYRRTHKAKPSEEIQSLLTLLFVQDHTIFSGLHINLRESWLNGADLPGARLKKVDLTQAHLKRTNLRRARLQGAILDEARLHGADLIEAYLQEASLRNSYLQIALLDAAKLQCANLAGARLRGAVLSSAYMHRAIFFDMSAGGAELQGAILQRTALHEADLRRAQLQGVGGNLMPGDTFARRMRRSIGRDCDLSLAIFEGGLRQNDLNALVRGLSDETANTLREELKRHIGKPRSHQLPEDSGAITGTYTEDEAEQWIAEYEEAMSEVPGEDS